jgi:hypothetical protein
VSGWRGPQVRHRRQLAQIHAREPGRMRLAPCGCRRHDSTKHALRSSVGVPLELDGDSISVSTGESIGIDFQPEKDTLIRYKVFDSVCLRCIADRSPGLGLGSKAWCCLWDRGVAGVGQHQHQTLRGKRNHGAMIHHNNLDAFRFVGSAINPDPIPRLSMSGQHCRGESAGSCGPESGTRSRQSEEPRVEPTCRSCINGLIT